MTSLPSCRIVAGTFDNKIVQLDAREEVKKMSYYKSHSRPVLKVKITPTKIYSISEDTNLVIHDRVAGKLYKKLKLPQITENLGQKNYPLSMDTVGNCLYVGDSAGHLNLFDTTSDTAFQFVQSYKTGTYRNSFYPVSYCGLGGLVIKTLLHVLLCIPSTKRCIFQNHGNGGTTVQVSRTNHN